VAARLWLEAIIPSLSMAFHASETPNFPSMNSGA
jgi:hypothetical protein